MKPTHSILAALLFAPMTTMALEPEYVSYVKPVYTTRLKNSEGGYNQMMSKMKVSFELLNTALRNSQISFEVQMVFPMEITNIVSSPFNEYGVLWDQIRNKDAQGIWSSFTSQGADHLSYFDTDSGAGAGQRPGEFTIIGSIGGSLFRHEMGHNFGCQHSDGFQTPSGGTIMNGNHIPYFSNPNLTYQGSPLGDATHNSSAIITANRPSSAGRRALKPNYFGLSSTWYMVAKHSSMAIDLRNGSTTPGAAITQWPLHYGANQQWKFNSLGGGVSTMERTSSGASAWLVSFNGNGNQTPATLQPWNTGKQRFFVEEQPDGYSRVRRDDNNGVLDVPAFSTSPDTQLHQWNWANGVNQRFKPVHKVD